MNKLNEIHTVTVPVEIPRALWAALIFRFSGFSDWKKQNQSQTDLATDIFIMPLLQWFASSLVDLLTQEQLDELGTVCQTSGGPLKSKHKGRFANFQKQTELICVGAPPLKLSVGPQLIGELTRLANERKTTVEKLVSPFVSTCLQDLLDDARIQGNLTP